MRGITPVVLFAASLAAAPSPAAVHQVAGSLTSDLPAEGGAQKRVGWARRCLSPEGDAAALE